MVELEHEDADVAVGEASEEARNIRAVINAFDGLFEALRLRVVQDLEGRELCGLACRWWRCSSHDAGFEVTGSRQRRYRCNSEL